MCFNLICVHSWPLSYQYCTLATALHSHSSLGSRVYEHSIFVKYLADTWWHHNQIIMMSWWLHKWNSDNGKIGLDTWYISWGKWHMTKLPDASLKGRQCSDMVWMIFWRQSSLLLMNLKVTTWMSITWLTYHFRYHFIVTFPVSSNYLMTVSAYHFQGIFGSALSFLL